MNALIVDDSRATRAILRRMLARWDFDIDEAEDGLQAIESLRSGTHYDLVLLDWNMPEMNGLEVLVTVREDDSLFQPKIVMVTTETEIEQVERALMAGADEYVMKPFTAEILEDKLRLLDIEVLSDGT